MKILVADDDAAVRQVVTRVIDHSVKQVTILEAGDGLAALQIIERQDPDILLTDLRMPILDGFELIEAVRRSPDHREMPIICLSWVNSREEIMRMANLGVTDYVLKPFRSTELADRLAKVVAATGNWKNRRQSPGQASVSDMVLVIDADPLFRSFVRSTLGPDFEVIGVGTGAEGLREFQSRQPKPALILVSERLTLPSEEKVADLVRRIATAAGATAPAIVLVSDTADVPREKAAHFTDVVRRTIVPAVFMEAVHTYFTAQPSLRERVRDFVAGAPQSWLLPAVVQTFVMLSGHEVTADAIQQASPIREGMRGSVLMTAPDGTCALRAGIACTNTHATALASVVLRRDATLEHDAPDVLREFAKSLGGRVMAAVAERGLQWTLGAPTLERFDRAAQQPRWHAHLRVQTADGEQFVVGVELLSDTVPSAATEGAGPPRTASAPV